MATQMATHPEGATPVADGGSQRPFRRRITMVVGAALLVIAGFVAGWALRGGDGASSPSYVVDGLVVAGDELTDRQVEMVDVTRLYVTAFMERDGDAVASFMVPDGRLVLPTLGNQVLHADDGTLQAWVEERGMIPNELNDPMIVQDDEVVVIGQLDALSAEWMILIEFTDSGEVEIVSDTHWAS